MKFTPDMNDGKRVFVFGSNLAGRHGAGAALEARKHWGAVNGIGQGQEGRSFAIPTKDKRLNTLMLSVIEREVGYFLRVAGANPETEYLVTRIGCGLAGYTDADIAPMFKHAPKNCILPEGWRKG
jgi:hypothetical protein